MSGIISKLIDKIGGAESLSVDRLSDGTESEKETLDRWKEILSEKNWTIDTVLTFCKVQVELIERMLRDVDNTPRKNERLVLLLGVWTLLRDFIESKQRERETLERHIETMLR